SVYSSPSYNGGPFLIAASNSFTAMALINKWNLGATNSSTYVAPYSTTRPSAKVMVHQYTGAGFFSAPVYRRLLAAPSICVYNNNQGYATGAYTYLNDARIPDSRGNTYLAWANSSPDALTEAQIAGATTTNHHDGGLFLTSGGLPKYSQFINMHWDPTRAYQAAYPNGAESIRELDTFLNYASSHVYAQCISVYTFENDLIAAGTYGGYGHWLTTGGMTYTGTGITKTAINQEVAFWPSAQATGQWTTATGAQTAFGMAAGSMFYGGTSSVIQYNLASTGGTYPYMYMSGYYHGLTGCGRVSYMCEHTSADTLPYTSNATGPAMRYFYDSLFMSPASSETVPQMYLTMTAPGQWQAGWQMTYTISYQNLSGIAYNVTVTDPYPANASFVSATGGGVSGGGVVTWNLGTLNVGASGTLTVTYMLNASPSGWDNQASAAYQSGPTHFNAYSQTVHTDSVVFTPTSTITPTLTVTSTRTSSPTITPTFTATPSFTPSFTTTPTVTPTATGTETSTQTPTATPSATSTITETFTASPTVTPTATITPSITVTSTITQTSSITPTLTHTPVFSSTTTPTYTSSPTITPTLTISATYTVSPTFTATGSATPTFTVTPTGSSTQTVTATYTITTTATITPTATSTPTVTLTIAMSATATASHTPVILTATPTPTPTSTVTPVGSGGAIYVYPNPFRPETAFEHVLKFEHCPDGSEIRIYTVSGELARKFTGVSGRQIWDGKNNGGADVVSGVYLYVIDQPGGLKTSGKIFVIR
ncbi:MAG: DUF11 domain-containing protein, partial [Candidatus Firestonebacteria bacterium]|nr:DUF11 domain-containing protein [Candidatus Firestonebacteria bacterium]